MEYLTYLYKFEAFIQRLEFNLRKPKQLSVLWRKGKKAVETERYSGYARGVMTIQQSLHLSLKLYKNPSNQQFQPKFSTFSVVEHENERRKVIMEAKFNLLEMLAAPSKQFVLVFSHGEIPGRLVFRGRQQMIMELNQFRYNTQELEESDGMPVEEREPSDQGQGEVFGEEELITLRKEIEDLNYLNGKLKNDRQKLLLRIREVEFEFKEKEKLVLREIRHAKTYFEKKIKIRENIYEEEIEKLVSEANEEQATFARVQEQLREEIRELRAKLSKAQSDLIVSREETTKLRYDVEDRIQQLKVAAVEKAQEQKRVSEVIHNMEGEIAKCQGQLRTMVGNLTNENENVKQQFGSKLQQLSYNLTTEIEKKLKDIAEKDRKISQLGKIIGEKDETIRKLHDTVRSIESVFSSNKVQLTKVELTMEDTIKKAEFLMAEKQELEEGLKSAEQEILKSKAQQRETKSKLEQAESEIDLLKEQLGRQIELAQRRESELHTDIDQLRQALEQKHHEIYEIKQRERTLEGQKESLELDLRNVNQLRKLDSQRISRVEAENIEIRRQCDLKEEEMQSRQAEFERHEDQMAGLRNNLHLMEMNKDDALGELEKLKKAMRHSEDLYEKKLEMLNAEIARMDDASKRDQRDTTIENLYEQIKTKEGDILKLNKKVRQLSETVAFLKKKEQNTSIDRDIMAEIVQMNSRDQDDMEEYSNQLLDTMRKEVLTLRKEIHLLKRESESKDKLIKQYKQTHGQMKQSIGKFDEMKQSLEVMRVEGVEQMKQTIMEKEKQIAKKQKEMSNLKQEADERIDELEAQVQKYMLEVDEKDAKIRQLTKKIGGQTAEFDQLDNQSVKGQVSGSSQKLKEVIKQLNKDHQAERQQLLKEIENLEATLEELRRSSIQTPTKPRSSHGSAKDNFSFMPEGKLASPKGDIDSRDRIKELQRKLMASEAEKNRLMNMVEDMERHVSIIRENTNEQEQSEDSIHNMFKGERDREDGRRRRVTPPGKSPRSVTQPAAHLNTVESERLFKGKEAMDLTELQNQMARMRMAHDEEIMRLNKQLVQKETSVKELQAQLTGFKEKEIEGRFIERELKMKDETIQSEKEKRRQLEAKLAEEGSARSRQIEKLEDQVKHFNTEFANNIREIEKYRVSIESKQRELADARKSKEDAVREFKEFRDNKEREAKKAYEQPAEVRLREISKELMKQKETQFELKNHIERLNEERKQKYVKMSDHKELRSEFQRLLKDKVSECDSLQRQLQQASQFRAKAEYTIRTLETEMDETKRRVLKLQDEHKTLIDDKDLDVRTTKKKLSALERQHEEYESKISQLQERQKFLGHEHQKALDELNKKVMQQLRENLIMKQQNEILGDEVKGWKKRHAEAGKIQSDIEDRLNLQGRQLDQLKRANEKLHKEVDERQEQLNRSIQESRKNSDEARRQAVLKEDVDREKREAEQQIQKLEKLLTVQETQVKRLTREMDKVRSKVAETQEDQFSSTKSIKLQMERQQEVRRKLEKILEQKEREIAGVVHRLQKSEEEKKQAIDSLNELYTEKLGLYVNQIDSIKKTIRDYEDQINYLKVQNRQSSEQLEKAHLHLSHLETELKICSESLDSKIIQLNFKRQENDRLKQQKYELELINAKLLTEINILTEDNRKMVEKLTKLSEYNRSQVDENQKLEMEVRVLKSHQQKVEYELSQLKPYPQRCRQYESMIKKMEAERQDLIEDIKHKNELIYSQADFERFQEQLKTSLAKDKELEMEEILQEFRQEADQANKKLEIEMVELMNESSRLRTDLERAKEHNAAILSENIRMIEFERQAAELGKKVAELDALLKEREKQSTQTRGSFEKSLKEMSTTIISLEKDLHTAKSERAEIEKQLVRGRKMQQDQAESLKRTEQKGMEVLQKLNEDLRNKLMQVEFENARLRENEVALQGAYEKRLGQIQRREEQKIKAVETGYAESIHRYESETERLKSMLDDLKYVIEDKNHEINFRREEIEYYEAELAKLNEQLKRTKTKVNEEKEVYSLELFKIGSRMKENDDQWGLKVKRLEDELSRVTNQLVQTSSRVERELTYSKLRVTDPEDKQTRKIQQKLKLKERTIEQLKQQILNMQQKLFKSEQDQLNRAPDSSGLVASLRAENDKLRDELRELHSAAKESSVVHKLELEVATLSQTSTTYKKELTKSKKTEQDLQQKIDSMLLQMQSAISEVTFLRGYESSYKELKTQYQKVNHELRSIQAEGHMNCQLQRDLLEKDKADLQETVKDLQQKVSQLTSQKMAREMIPKKAQPKEDSETTARIRESLNQYRQELNKREAILNRQMEVLKERNSGLLEKVKKIETERDEASRKINMLNQHITELNEENIRSSEEIFRLNSNIMKEEFTLEDVRDVVQVKWDTLAATVMAAVGMPLSQGVTYLIDSHHEREASQQEFRTQRQNYEKQIYRLAEQLADMRERLQIRQQQFKFQRERDSLDIEQLTKETEKLQQRVNDLQQQIQGYENLQIEFQRMQYEYNNCKILLDVCRAQLQQLRSALRVQNQTFLPKQQIVQDLQDILSKVHQH